jgi:hypothetical protein
MGKKKSIFNNPKNAIKLASSLLILATISVLIIKVKKANASDISIPIWGGY